MIASVNLKLKRNVHMKNENCPCKKNKCERYGNCEAGRACHAESKRKRPCENKNILAPFKK